MFKTNYLRDEKGASKFGTCVSCGKDSNEDYNMIRLTFENNSKKNSIIQIARCK